MPGSFAGLPVELPAHDGDENERNDYHNGNEPGGGGRLTELAPLADGFEVLLDANSAIRPFVAHFTLAIAHTELLIPTW